MGVMAFMSSSRVYKAQVLPQTGRLSSRDSFVLKPPNFGVASSFLMIYFLNTTMLATPGDDKIRSSDPVFSCNIVQSVRRLI